MFHAQKRLRLLSGAALLALAFLLALSLPEAQGRRNRKRQPRQQRPLGPDPLAPTNPIDGLIVRPKEAWNAAYSPSGPKVTANERVYLLGNAGLEDFHWKAVTTADWLVADPAEGLLERGKRTSVKVTVVEGEAEYLIPGSHPAVVFFTNETTGKGSAPREVTLRVKSSPGLSVSPVGPFDVRLGTDAQGPALTRVYWVDNRAARDLTYKVSADQPWLHVQPREGILPAGGSVPISVAVDPARVPSEPGEHTGAVRFERVGDEQHDQRFRMREVRVEVGPANGLEVHAKEGEAASYLLRNASPTPIRWQAEAVGEGLSVEPGNGELLEGQEVLVEATVPAEKDEADPKGIVFVNATSGIGTTTKLLSEPPTGALRTTCVSQFGITWTFDREVEVGRFANGDFWVVGPVSVVDIQPRARTIGSRSMNGSMLNPSPSYKAQGYDSAMFGPYRSPGSYRERRNVGVDVSKTNPLILAPHSSLVSTISVPMGGARPQLDTAAILTVLPEPAAPGSFRPPYCGSKKEVAFHVDQLDRSLLQKLAPTPSAPPIRKITAGFERPWLDHIPDWVGRYHHPAQNMPDYGREICDLVSSASLMLHLDLPDEEKEKLLIRFVQVGIDFFGIVQDGGQNNWPAGGGHHSGRKWPILFAGLMLGDPGMMAIGERKNVAFNEDDQTFYVQETSPGRYNKGKGKYGPEHVGMAEWGNQHAKNLDQDDVRWSDDGTNKHLDYRTCCTANVWWGELLAAHVMGAKGLWNHDPLFDYQDRYREVTRGSGQTGWTVAWSPFQLEMWDRYRKNY